MIKSIGLGFLKIYLTAFLLPLSFWGCSNSSSSGAIDSIFGGVSNRPILTAVTTQVIQQTNELKVDVNNTKKSSPGDDQGMTYSCSWDRHTDGAVAETQSCDSLPGSSVQFSSTAGTLLWTSSTNELGSFEIKIKGTNENGSDDRVFSVDVRLKFAGLESLTQVQGERMTLNWTANPSSSGYQILKKGTDGTYTVYQTVSSSSASSVTVTGLTPLESYTWKVAAIDTLGQQDGNQVSLTAITADLIRLEVTSAVSQLSPGQSTSVTVRLKDNGGNYLTNSGLSVGLSLVGSGTSSGTFSSVNDLGNGIYTATFTATSPGTINAITASLTQYYYVEQTAAITVSPLRIEILATSTSLNPNRSINLTAKIRDYSGALISWGGHSLTFNYSGGSSTGTFSAVSDLGNGTYTATLTGGTAGTAVTLGASISTTSQIYSSVSITVLPYQIELTSAISDLSITRTTTITGRVKDWQGNYMTSGGQGLAMSVVGTAGVATLSAVTDHSNGTYTATLSGLSLGSIVVTASLTPSYQVSQTAAITVRKLRLEVTSTASQLMPGQTTNLTGRVKDWQGNIVGVGGQSFDFAATGGTSSGTISSVTDNNNGTYSATFTASSAGTPIAVTGSISDSYQVDVTAAITVQKWLLYVSSSASSVLAGQTATITVTVKDSSGNQATTGGQSIFISQAVGTSSGTIGTVTDNNNGTYTATFSAISPGTALTISASQTQSYQVMQTASITVTAIHLSLSVSQSSMNPSGSVLVSAQVKDSLGNNVLTGSYSIAFTNSGGTSTGTFGLTTNLGLGSYQATFTGGTAGTATTITAYSSSSYVVDQTVSVTVVPWNVEIASTQSSFVINETGTITARIKDWQGNYLTSGGKNLSLSLVTPGKATLGATSDNNDGTYTASFLAQAVGTTNFSVSMIESFSVSINPTLTIEKAYIYVTVGSGASSATLNSGSNIIATATIKNSSGGMVNGTGYTLSFNASGGTSGLVAQTAVAEVSAGIYQITYQGSTAGTATTISASMTSTYQSSSTASVTVVPSATISAANSGLTVTSTILRSGLSVTLTATMRDASNNLMPGLGNVVFSQTTGAGIGTATLGPVTDNSDGTYTASLTGVTPGNDPIVVSVVGGAGSLAVSQTVSVTVTSGAASKLTLAGPTSLNSNSCSTAFSLSFYDSNDNSTTLSANTNFSVTGLGNAVLYSDSSCTTQISQVSVVSGAAQSQDFYLKSFEAASYNLVFSAAGITQTNSAFTVTTSAVLSWLGSTGNVDTNGSGDFYGAGLWDGTFTTPYQIATATLGGEKYLFVADYATSNLQKIKITDINSISVVGALGRTHFSKKGTPTGGTDPTYCTGLGVSVGVNGAFCTGGQYYAGTGDAMFTNPYGSTVLAVGGTNYLFVTDYGNSRIVKYNADTGAYIGWTGLIATTTGMSGACLAAGAGATTPGWCTGGTSVANSSASVAVSGATTGGTSSGGNQFRSPSVITNDGVYIYFNDSGNNRIIKMDPTTGLVVHWMGRVSSVGVGGSDGTTSPTALSCLSNTQSDGTSNIVAGQFTPTWCSGGASVGTALGQGSYTNASLNPQFSSARGLGFYSDGTYNWMIVSDAHRIVRFFCGATTATPGCNVNSAVSINSVNYYPGHYFGWTGYISTVSANVATIPTSISSFFNYTSGASVGVVTNGWAYYGNNTSIQNVNGAIYTGYGLTISGSYAYVISYSDYRVNRLKLTGSTGGRIDGWIGRVSGTPTSGVTGCAGTSAGTVTPGWCYGGYATWGYTVGSFYNPTSIDNDGTYLYISDVTNNRITIHNMSTGAPVGAMGLRVNNLKNGWQVASSYPSGTNVPANTLGNPSIINRDYLFYNPGHVLVQGNYMYVSDISSNRIKRYNWLDGTFQGWIGMTYSLFAPTGGDPNCASSLIGGFTPGWCSGGGFTSSNTFGFSTPQGLASDGTYLYVADQGNHRIVRIKLSDATFSGWIGYIGSLQPSEGDAGCSTAATGTVTPGWCIGGTAASTGSTYALGGFNGPHGLAGFTDTDGKFYLIVGDSGNSRLQKIDVSNPSAAQWVGRNSSGVTNCGVPSGDMVMAWCSTSGVASTTTSTTSNINNGYLGTALYGIYVGPTKFGTSPNEYYNVFVTSYTSGTGRVMRFNATTGAFTGWIGTIAVTTNHGCSSTPTAGGATPGWCTGGIPGSGSGDGHFSAGVFGVYADSSYLYVADATNYRINKFNLSSGTFVGWKGRVLSATGLGGGTGCSTTTAGNITPTWCTGGTAKGGFTIDAANNAAALDYPRGLAAAGGHLILCDSANGRLLMMPK